MRKLISVLLLTVMMLFLCCCAPKQPHKLLENAPADGNDMALLFFDGNETVVKWISQKNDKEKIISGINALKAYAVDSDGIPELKFPCFGIETGDYSLTYSNGYWLDKNGSVYKAEYDFVLAFQTTGETDNHRGGLRMPNAWYLGQKDVRFYRKESEGRNERAGLAISFVSYQDKIATVKMTNTAHVGGTVVEYFTLQKKIDGVWYTIPPKEPIAFHDIAYEVEGGKDIDMKCDLSPYGDLTPGMYRIEKHEIVCEFEIK